MMAALGVPVFRNVLGLPATDRLCLLVVDGLGWEQLRDHEREAPFLNELARSCRSITTGFPSTTAASVASLGTGLPPGGHGLAGYTLLLPGHSRAMNVLRWTPYGVGHAETNLLSKLDPEDFQPRACVFEVAHDHKVDVLLTGPAVHEHSGLSRAVLRGGRFRVAVSPGDLAGVALGHLDGPGVRFVYAHYNELDTTGHVRGVDSPAWRLQLSLIDRMCETLAAQLPSGAVLVITGDHGMVDLRADQRLDLDDYPALSHGVRVMAGEGRARYLYTQHGQEQHVLDAWRAVLGDRMWVLPRDEAVSAGWFGPDVTEAARSRLGDVVAAARPGIGIFQRSVDPGQASLVGHHGSLTPAEQLVPLLVAGR